MITINQEDPKGLNRHQGLPARESGMGCHTANFAMRPLGSMARGAAVQVDEGEARVTVHE